MPAHSNYFPVRTGDQIQWLKNYKQKIGGYLTAGGYLITEISATQADADFCTNLLELLQPQVTQYAQGITAYVRLILEGPASTVLVPVPTFNVASAGTPVLPGALKRIFAFIANKKTRAFCTVAVQQDLGIVGAAVPAPDPVASQPALKVQLIAGGLPEVLWKKGVFDGIRLQIDRSDTKGWVALAVDMKPNFTDDLSPLPAPGHSTVWQYRAIYLLNDADYGQWSDAVSVTVAG